MDTDLTAASALLPAIGYTVSLVAFGRRLFPKVDGAIRVLAATVGAALGVVVWLQARGPGGFNLRQLFADVPVVVVAAYGGVAFVQRLQGRSPPA